ncbi:hypothetical protein H0H93_009984 [Arthromyces matolae]|nr:hypothetical protein H0H93_009984 [Arthromyces matolae]
MRIRSFLFLASAFAFLILATPIPSSIGGGGRDMDNQDGSDFELEPSIPSRSSLTSVTYHPSIKKDIRSDEDQEAIRKWKEAQMAGPDEEEYLHSVERAREQARIRGQDPDKAEEDFVWNQMEEYQSQQHNEDAIGKNEGKGLGKDKIDHQTLQDIAAYEAKLKTNTRSWELYMTAVEKSKGKAIANKKNVEDAVTRTKLSRLNRWKREEKRKGDMKKTREEKTNTDHSRSGLVPTQSSPAPHPQEKRQHREKTPQQLEMSLTFSSDPDL